MTIGGRDGREEGFESATLQSEVYEKMLYQLVKATYGGYMSNAVSSSTTGLRPNSSARRTA